MHRDCGGITYLHVSDVLLWNIAKIDVDDLAFIKSFKNIRL